MGKSVFKNGSSKMFGMQTLKNLKRAALTDHIISNFLKAALKAAFLNFTWSIREYYVSVSLHILNIGRN